jgi:hypothetical protein
MSYNIINYPDLTGCELVKDVFTTNYQFEDIYNNNTVNPYPSLIICGDKRKKQNQEIYEKFMDHKTLVVNNDPECKVDFNVRNLNNSTNLQNGYAKNIDLDSELKRINHITDKCYYDNYKYHPFESLPGNGLNCHKNTLVNDYSKVGKPTQCAIPLNDEFKSVIQPGHLQPDYKKPFPKYMSSRNVNYGYYTTGDYSPTERFQYQGCSNYDGNINKYTTFTQFDIYKKHNDYNKNINYPHNISDNTSTVNYYKFNGDVNNQHVKLTQNFPPQKLFNNNTKRSTLNNFNELNDINPKYLT